MYQQKLILVNKMETIKYILIDALCMGLPYALLSLGIFISYRMLDFSDLTCEGSFTLGGAVCVVAIILGINPWIASLLGGASGFLAGIITALLHTKLKIPSLLSGIITMTALFSINLLVMGITKENASFAQSFDTVAYVGKNETIFDSFLGFFNNRNMNVIFISAIIVILFVLFIYWFFGTEFGMSIRATGMNQQMARSQGVNTTIMIIIGLAISNFLIAISGSLTAQYTMSAKSDMGTGALVIGLASIILGEALFGKRTFKNWIISVTLGAIVYYLIIGIAINLGFPTFLLKLLYALLIIVILVFPLIKNSLKKKEVKSC